jgi:hypothetical protein
MIIPVLSQVVAPLLPSYSPPWHDSGVWFEYEAFADCVTLGHKGDTKLYHFSGL